MNGAASCTPMRNEAATIVRDVLGDVAGERHLARLEDRVAVVHRRDDEMMHVGGEDQRHAEHGEEVADQHALLVLRRIDRGDEAEAELLRHHGAGDLQRRNREPRGDAEHEADEDLLDHFDDQRHQCVEIDRVGLPVQRQQHRGQRQRDGEPHARRQIRLADARQQHDHGADPAEGQHEGRGERRQEGDVDAHLKAFAGA